MPRNVDKLDKLFLLLDLRFWSFGDASLQLLPILTLLFPIIHPVHSSWGWNGGPMSGQPRTILWSDGRCTRSLYRPHWDTRSCQATRDEEPILSHGSHSPPMCKKKLDNILVSFVALSLKKHSRVNRLRTSVSTDRLDYK